MFPIDVFQQLNRTIDSPLVLSIASFQRSVDRVLQRLGSRLVLARFQRPRGLSTTDTLCISCVFDDLIGLLTGMLNSS